jgi:hypothetical protein
MRIAQLVQHVTQDIAARNTLQGKRAIIWPILLAVFQAGI